MGNETTKRTRHILSLSGGKDSTALAVYMRDRVPEMEYVFCDTGEELKETDEYLLKIEAFLGKKIKRLQPLIPEGRCNKKRSPFEHFLHDIYGGVLPDPRTRWCTKMLKIRPFEQYVGETPVVLYVGIRSDEPSRKGYISTKPNIKARLPFVEDNVVREDVFRILDEAGLGLPDYYKWRSRSGCYFCFFQQRREWVGLLETHPDLFKKAMEFEKTDTLTGERYTWIQGESLAELAQPERVAQIKADYEKRRQRQSDFKPAASLGEVFEFCDDNSNRGCLICHL